MKRLFTLASAAAAMAAVLTLATATSCNKDVPEDTPSDTPSTPSTVDLTPVETEGYCILCAPTEDCFSHTLKVEESTMFVPMIMTGGFSTTLIKDSFDASILSNSDKEVVDVKLLPDYDYLLIQVTGLKEGTADVVIQVREKAKGLTKAKVLTRRTIKITVGEAAPVDYLDEGFCFVETDFSDVKSDQQIILGNWAQYRLYTLRDGKPYQVAAYGAFDFVVKPGYDDSIIKPQSVHSGSSEFFAIMGAALGSTDVTFEVWTKDEGPMLILRKTLHVTVVDATE